MNKQADPSLLDAPEALEAADPGGMLRQVASAAAQVREAQLAVADAGLDRWLRRIDRPRAIVVAGMGGSGIAGDVLAAVCGTGCPVPITTVRGYRLPGWVGAADLVIAVSCSGGTEETVAAATEAVRRGARLLCVAAPGSPLADIAVQAGAPLVPVRSVGQPRATLWGLSVPPLLAVRSLGLIDLPDDVLEATAARLEEVSRRCRPASDSFVNPGKEMALQLAGTVPMIWGTSPLAGTVAYRFACQLAENAKYPAIHGELPEANHNQVMAFEGGFAGTSPAGDLFRDRVEEPEPARLRLIIVRDTDEHPQVARRREVSARLAHERGMGVTELSAEPGHPLERLAGLIAHVDYATVYLALAVGADPTPVAAIQELKARITQ